MAKWLVGCLTAALLVSSSAGWASTLEKNMKTLRQHYEAAQKAENVDMLKQELSVMREAAVKSQQEVPDKLKHEPKDSAKLSDYRQGLDKLIAGIDQATALASEGKFSEAQKATQMLADVRNEYHKKYK